MKTTNTILLDVFSQRILEVYKELTLRGAIDKKNEFIKALGVPASSFAMLESYHRNFKKSEEARNSAKYGLLSAFFVNPDYIDDKSEVMFVSEPKSLLRVESINLRQFNFHAKKEKEVLAKELMETLDENKSLKSRIEELENELKDIKLKLQPGQ